MSADGQTALDSLNWAASSGGSAGLAETTSTLGVDRQDSRSPPDLTRVWAAQINACKNFNILVSQTFKGGTRLGCLTQTSSPFGVGEQGLWIDTSGNLYFAYGGVNSQLVTSVGQRGWSAITTGTGNGHEYLDVTLGTPFASATGSSGYNVETQISLTTATDAGIVCWIINKTTNSFRIQFSGDFNGEVRWRAF